MKFTPTTPGVCNSVCARRVAIALLSLSAALPAFAQTWTGATSGSWMEAGNWSTQAPQNGDELIFETSATTAATMNFSDLSVKSLTFSSNASKFVTTITAASKLRFQDGTGISNQSGRVQKFINEGSSVAGIEGGSLYFAQGSAGDVTISNKGGAALNAAGGHTEFLNESTSGSSRIVNDGADAKGGYGGETFFKNDSNAGTSHIINNGGSVAKTEGGYLEFSNHASAAGSTITNNGATKKNSAGGLVVFRNFSDAGGSEITTNGAAGNGEFGGQTAFTNHSSAGSATLIANGSTNGGGGGEIYFDRNATGEGARVVINEGGLLDISSSTVTGNNPFVGLTIGSIEGAGNVALGGYNLTTGNLNTSTTVSGVIHDGGIFNNLGGSLGKVGDGTLTLAGENTYTGLTLVYGGSLVVEGSILNSQAILVLDAGSLVLSGEHNADGGRIGDTAFVALGTTGSFRLDTTVEIDETIGSLAIGGESVIDFGQGAAGGKLHFGPSDDFWDGTLSLFNWSGSLAGNGLDQIFFESRLSEEHLAQITFFNESGDNLGHARFVSEFSNEIVPAGVPEPAAFLAGAFLLGVIGIGRPGRSFQRA